MHEFWNGYGGVFVIDMKRLWINRIRLVTSLVQPLLYLFVLGAGMGGTSRLGGTGYQRYIFPGILAMSMLFSGSAAAITIVVDRQVGFLKAVIAAPVPRSAIALGKISSGAVQALAPACALLLFAPWLGLQLSWPMLAALLPAMALTALVFAALGVGIAARLRTITLFPVFSNTVLLPLFFLSGAIYPLDAAPSWLQGLARFNPAAYAVDLLRACLGGRPTLHVPTLSLAVLAAFLAAFAALASKVFDAEPV